MSGLEQVSALAQRKLSSGKIISVSSSSLKPKHHSFGLTSAGEFLNFYKNQTFPLFLSLILVKYQFLILVFLRNETLEYMNKSKTMVRKLLEYLGKNLNVKELDETKESLFMGSIRVNLNYYPICPNPDLTVGVGRHSDVSSLTILLQDQIGGLHVRSLSSGNWVHVPPVPGSFVINIGDAMQIMSNGRYKSVEHRVLANGSSNRISVPIFVNPKPESVIGPLPEVTANGEEPIYRDVVYSDYVRYFFRKAHDGKKTVDFAKI